MVAPDNGGARCYIAYNRTDSGKVENGGADKDIFEIGSGQQAQGDAGCRGYGNARPSLMPFKSPKHLTTSDGRRIDVWELSVPSTADYLSAWASLFRQHYCPDAEIDGLRAGTGLSRAEYLTQLIFPDRRAAPGPSIRAGDFAELLVADYVEHILRYWVPRDKYAEKASRDESVKGVDILGFSPSTTQPPAPTDTLLAFEVKAQFSGEKYAGRLQTAIDDSSKDYLRRAITLNATKRRLLRVGQHDRALVVERFQNLSDRPYVYRSGACRRLVRRGLRRGFTSERNDGRGPPECGEHRTHRDSRQGTNEAGSHSIRTGFQ